MIFCEINREKGRIKEELVEKWARAIFKFLKIKNAGISVAVVDNETIKKINKKYRNKNKPTDVLSFREKESASFPGSAKNFLGEIIISFEKTVEEAKEDGETVEETFKKLLAHGILHLLGYDHEKSEVEEKKMLNLQTEILKKI
jgi:probable rRNA maturation factor